jgi:hypothetical protein
MVFLYPQTEKDCKSNSVLPVYQKKLHESEKVMHQILKNIIDARKKDLRPQIASVSSLHTVQMRFLAFFNAVCFVWANVSQSRTARFC